MSDSSRPQSDDAAFEEAKQGWLTAIHDQLADREAKCKAIAEYADKMLLDCDWQFVNRHFKWFEMWYHGVVATGYLINRTGIKRKGHDISDWS